MAAFDDENVFSVSWQTEGMIEYEAWDKNDGCGRDRGPVLGGPEAQFIMFIFGSRKYVDILTDIV